MVARFLIPCTRTLHVFCALLVASIAAPAPVSAQDAARIALGKPVLKTAAYFTDISSVVRLASGDLVVADPGGQELVLVVRESGRTRVLGRESVGTLDGAASPLSADDRGQVFFRGLNGIDDEGPVIRLSVQTGRIDTVVRLAGPKLVDITGGNARAIGRQVWRVMPYSDVDAFVALSGGGHMIARSRSNRLEWYDTHGRLVSTTAFPGKRSPMTDSIRKTVTPVQMQAVLPATLPAFEYDAVIRSTGNRVWIRATTRVGDESIWYGFSPGEQKPRVLTLPRGARLVGAFEPWLIVARRNASELQQIEIYRL